MPRVRVARHGWAIFLGMDESEPPDRSASDIARPSAAVDAGAAVIAGTLRIATGSPLDALGDAKQLLRAIFGDNTESLMAAVNAITEDAALRRLPELERAVEELQAGTSGEAPARSYLIVVTEAFKRSWWKATDRRRQRLAENGLINAFQPELYEEGMARRLFLNLDELDFGDVVLLEEVNGGGAVLPWRHIASLKAWHADRLLAAGLIAELGDRRDPRENHRVIITELGIRLLRFVAEREVASAAGV